MKKYGIRSQTLSVVIFILTLSLSWIPQNSWSVQPNDQIRLWAVLNAIFFSTIYEPEPGVTCDFKEPQNSSNHDVCEAFFRAPGGTELWRSSAWVSFGDHRGDFAFSQNDQFNQCSLIIAADGMAASASFKLQDDRTKDNYFSFIDSNGTIIWGLFIHSLNEEWSGAGVGSGSVLGKLIYPQVMEVTITWDGPAVENNPSNTADGQIRIKCYFFRSNIGG